MDTIKTFAHDDVDMEKGGVTSSPGDQSFDKSSNRSNAVEVMEASALLLLWSLLVVNEGAVRFMNSTPWNLSRPGENFSPYLIFFGGLAEVIFGVMGVWLAYAAFIPRYYSTGITRLCMIVQAILGWFVFITFVFADPIVKIRNLPSGDAFLPGLSLGAAKFVMTLGILTSFHFCLALQGGQFVFMARLICAASGSDFLKQRSGTLMRALFWNGNLALSGLWTLITGAVIRGQVGAGKLLQAYVSPPNVGTLPSITIVCGIIMLCWGLVGVGMALSKAAPPAYFIVTGLVYVAMLLNFGILQFGFFRDGTAGGPVAMHNGLVFMVVFIGAYFVLKNAKQNDDEM